MSGIPNRNHPRFLSLLLTKFFRGTNAQVGILDVAIDFNFIIFSALCVGTGQRSGDKQNVAHS